MEITWLGAAGFCLKTGHQVILLDPYLSRNSKATPFQPLAPGDLRKASHIFISHGHFDHVMDVPRITRISSAMVFCSNTVGDALEKQGALDGFIKRIGRHRWSGRFSWLTAEAFYSRHIRFDPGLVLSTLVNMKCDLIKNVQLLTQYPCGQVLSWRFVLENKSLHFFGTAGASIDELKALSRFPLDILLVPLQGHSRICNIAADYVKILKPSIVIPHHHDNFYPPISQTVDIAPFLRIVEKECPQTRVMVPSINEPLLL